MAVTTTTSSTSAATPAIQVQGVGSGLDVKTIVAQLVAADRLQDDTRIAREKTAVATEVSALGTLKGALSSFQTALAPLKTLSALQVRSANSADETIFTATAASGSVAGSYNVEVTQLAKAQQLVSTNFAAGNATVVGTGTLTFAQGTTSFAVNIDSSNNTLAGIRDAINKAPDNKGVQATIVQAVDGSHLVLSSTKTGAANGIVVAASDGDGGLAALTYGAGNTTHYTQATLAQDSIIKIADLEHHAATNVVSDAIDGVTITLKAEKPGTKVKLDITNNTAAVTSSVNAFVSQYNALQSQLAKLGSFDTSTQTAGPLLGDALLNSINSQVRVGLTSAVAGLKGTYTSLSSIGITTQKDGSLSVDADKLNAALGQDFNAAGAIFGSDNGVAARLSTLTDQWLAPNASIATRNASLDKQGKNITQEQTALEARVAIVQARYQAQFSALDTLLSSTQTTSNYLTQQFAAISNIGK